MADPILERIVYYSEIDRDTAQLALAVARLGQVVWQLEQQERMRQQGVSVDGEAAVDAEVEV